jgi:hypothetical protein
LTGNEKPPRVTWDQVLGWRMKRQWLSQTTRGNAVDVVRRLAGVQALAWQGILCNGPSNGGRVTFARPDSSFPGWSGLPAEDEAAPVAVLTYLGAHGPASAATFDQWLSSGSSKKASVRAWFAELGDRLTVVDVEGAELYARTEDVADLLEAVRDDTVRLLPAFDQYVLGPGTSDVHIIAAHRRRFISRAAGWISPVVVAGDKVVGTWRVTQRSPRD